MPLIRSSEAVTHDMNGARFTAYAAPARGAAEVCAWRLDLPAGQPGQPHRITREEVFYVLAGAPRVRLDGASHELAAGDVLVAPAGATLAVENPGDAPAQFWVSCSVGLEAELADGSRITPPWVR